MKNANRGWLLIASLAAGSASADALAPLVDAEPKVQLVAMATTEGEREQLTQAIPVDFIDIAEPTVLEVTAPAHKLSPWMLQGLWAAAIMALGLVMGSGWRRSWNFRVAQSE
jgi:hypothetical protein